MNTTQNTISLLGRILLAAMFILSGAGKITAYAGTAGYMAAHGLPALLLPLVILLELGGGLAILFGFRTRMTATFLALFCVLAALFFHNDFGDQAQFINFMKNMSIAGGFLTLAVHGPGLLSWDGWRRA